MVEPQYGERLYLMFIVFSPPLGRVVTFLLARNFFLGNTDTKSAGGRGYPGAIKALWVARQRQAIVELWDNYPEKDILEAADRKQTFASVTVMAENEEPMKKQTVMRVVKIVRFSQPHSEPAKIHLEFENIVHPQS